MKLSIFAILLLLPFCNCNRVKTEIKGVTLSKAKPVDSSECLSSSPFNRNDSAGVLVGPVVHFSDTSAGSSSGGITIKDKGGDSISFLFSYDEAKNIDIKKLSVGSCVGIKYHVQIFKEEGIETNRLFFVDEIDYK
jgi:hypothetical protein